MPILWRILILSHRYLGIPLSLLFVMWFASGIVMIYTGGMPRLTSQERLERLPTLDLSKVKISAAEAAASAGDSGVPPRIVPRRIVMSSVMDRPAYRFQGLGSETIFADSGEALGEVSLDQAQAIASRFANQPNEHVHFLRTVKEPDQWTLQLGRDMPLYKFRIENAAATELYVPSQ